MSFKKGLQKFYKSKMIIPLIFVFALLIGIAGYYKYSNIPVLGDAALFKSLGQEVLSGEWLTSDNFGYARTPGYPIILGTIYAIFRNNDIYVKFIQVIVYSIIPLVIIYIGSVLFNRMVGIVSALWYVTYYEYVKFSYLIMREIWITLFILLILLFFILYIRRNRTRDIIIGSICFGCLIMIDPRYVFFIFILLGFGLFFSKKWIHKMRDISIIIIGVAIFLVPWSVHQSRTYGRLIIFSPLRDEQIFSFFKISKDITGEKRYYPYDMKREDYLRSLSKSNVSSTKIKELEKLITVEYIQELRRRIPQNKIKIYLYRFYDYWRFARFKIGIGVGTDVRFRFPWGLSKSINNIIHIGLLLPFIFIGVYKIFKKLQLIHLFFISIFIYHLLFHIIVHYLYRYRITILPVLFLIGWSGISYIFKKPGERFS